ncbi:MAG: NUDIX domain-containing protein [Patescibacteria group bacterium]
MNHANLPIAVHIFFIKGKQILLLQRVGTGFQDGKWSVPAGRLNTGESITSAAIREAQEEIGVKINTKELSQPLIMHHHDERGERIYAFFICKAWQGEPRNMEPTVCSDLKWFTLGELPINSMVTHVNYAVERLLENVRYVEYGFEVKT